MAGAGAGRLRREGRGWASVAGVHQGAWADPGLNEREVCRPGGVRAYELGRRD